MKRFTETNKWADPWFRKLCPAAKLLWGYMCDNCDHAGVIELDAEMAAMQMGVRERDVDPAKLGDRVTMLPCGKWLVRRFVEFQYGKISRDCKAHGPVFASIEKHGLERVCEGLAKGPMGGMYTPQDKDTDKDTDKDKDKDKVKDKDTDPAVAPTLAQWLVRVSPENDWEAEWWTKKYRTEATAGWEMRGGRKVRNWHERQDSFMPYFRSDQAEHNAANAPPDTAAFEAERAAELERRTAAELASQAELQAALAGGRE